jgi:hypothetical protein
MNLKISGLKARKVLDKKGRNYPESLIKTDEEGSVDKNINLFVKAP